MAKSKRSRNTQITRKVNSREPYELIAIVCEGSHTEPHYYINIRTVERIHTANVCITGECGTDPVSVVKKAIEIYQESLAQKRAAAIYDVIFCVIDRDKHPNFEEALLLIEKYNKELKKPLIFPIRSYPSFEIWYLFHFKYTRSAFHGNQKNSSGDLCEKELNGEWRQSFGIEYTKSALDIYTRLKEKSLINQAIKHAKMAIDDVKLTNDPNPSTEAHILYEYMIQMTNSQGIKSILDNLYVITSKIEHKLESDQFDGEKFIVLLDNFLKEIDYEMVILDKAISGTTGINTSRLTFMKKYLVELKNKITLVKQSLIE